MFHQTNPTLTDAWPTAVQQVTQTRPWLTPFLLRQSPHLFTRFADYYSQLLTTPRKVRRQLGAGLATAALLLALSNSPAHAATIIGGAGWDCGPLNGAGTTHVANTSVTRTGLNSFSDWAVGDAVGPTAVTNLLSQTTSPPPPPFSLCWPPCWPLSAGCGCGDGRRGAGLS